MSKKHKGKTPTSIDPRDVKIRKRIAPGVRIIKSSLEKEEKHKKDYRQEVDDASD